MLPDAAELIRKYEGCSLTAYKDPVGILTIGYGHTGADVTPGLEISQAKADEILSRDLEHFTQAVRDLVTVPLSPGQLAALVSFTYNVGVKAFELSTLRRLVNMKHHTEAAAEFKKWIRAGRAVLPGLVKRRAAEAAMYLADATSTPTPTN